MLRQIRIPAVLDDEISYIKFIRSIHSNLGNPVLWAGSEFFGSAWNHEPILPYVPVFAEKANT